MPTDDELTALLRRGFAQATSDLDPKPDLVHVIHRRRLSARRRRVAVGVAVPAAAAVAAGSGFVLAGRGTPNHAPSPAPSHTAVAVVPPSAPPTSASTPKTTPTKSVPVKHAGYRLVRQVVRRHHSAPPNCPANATAPVAKSENPSPGAWFWTNGRCFFVGIGGADTKPADATPVHIKGYPGLYSTRRNGVRTIYAPGIGHPRGWWVLTMAANTPVQTAVRMLVPAN